MEANAAEEYRRLKRRAREALSVEVLTDNDLEAIRSAEVDPRYGYLDAELK